MLHVITSPADPLISLVEADPVRPHIPREKRADVNSRVLVLMDEHQQPQSVVCVALSDQIVTEEHQLFEYQGHQPRVAVLYTIWSIARGGGVAMIPVAREWIQTTYPTVDKLITLSPHTEMARRFHIKNGAHELQMNANTVNFEYALC